MKRKCLYCQEEFEGRSDKRFCCDQCRNAYNNQNKKIHEQFILDINKILRKNRMVLHQLNPIGRSTIRKEYMLKLGFDFQFYTHTYTTKNNNTYRFCYEYGYFEIDNEKVLVITWQPYMKTQT